MSLERHQPNRAVDLNLAKARDLRSAYLWGCIANIPEFIARMWRAGRRGPALDGACLRTLPASNAFDRNVTAIAGNEHTAPWQ